MRILAQIPVHNRRASGSAAHPPLPEAGGGWAALPDADGCGQGFGLFNIPRHLHPNHGLNQFCFIFLLSVLTGY